MAYGRASATSGGRSRNWSSTLKRKTEAELRRSQITKTARTLIRLKHSLAADEEINAVLPDTLEQFDEALARGELKQISQRLDDIIQG